jgi:hypothetical protein
MTTRAWTWTVLFLGLVGTGCSGIPSVNDYETIDGPPFGSQGITFQPVSRVMEARCGTLDCHGQISRPLRIFGQQGLRLPTMHPEPGYVTAGTVGTTPEELLANYASMIGLEPEKLKKVVEGQADPDSLTLVRKPRLTEKHKGGKIWSQNDFGDACIIKWLTDVTVPGSTPKELDTSDCDKELEHF